MRASYRILSDTVRSEHSEAPTIRIGLFAGFPQWRAGAFPTALQFVSHHFSTQRTNEHMELWMPPAAARRAEAPWQPGALKP